MDGAFFVVMGGFLINRCYVQDCSLKPGISGACQPGVRADDPIPQDTDKSPAKYNVQDYSLNIEHDLSGAGQLAAAGASPDGPTPQAIDKSPTRCNLQDCFLEPVVFRAGQLALPDSSILPQGTDKGPARCKAQDCSLELGVYRTILTPDGFIHCLEEGFIDETSFDKPAMVDKGKANRIAKLVAFLQAMWLVVQSFARWRDYRHLPLTLLEIHVLLQVACTTFTYICWWSKPLDVSEPITITLKRPGMSAGSTSQASKAPPPDSGPSPPPKMASPLSACTTLYEISETKDDNDAPNSPESEDHTPDPPEFKDHSEIQSLFNKSQNNIKLHYLTTKKPESHGLLVMLKALCDVMTPIISAAKGEDADTTTTNSKKGPKKYSGTRVMILEVALVLVVGGIHFIALKYDFATETERTLWILACSGIIVLPMIVIFIVIFTRYEGNLFQIIWQVPFNNMNGHSLLVYAFKSIHGICTEKAMKHRGEKRDFLYYVWVLCHYILVWICIILLITALSLSLLLTVESYMSLRLPPRGSFNTPRWTDWWPHI